MTYLQNIFPFLFRKIPSGKAKEEHVWTRPHPARWPHKSCLETPAGSAQRCLKLCPRSVPYPALGAHSSSQGKQKLKILLVLHEKEKKKSHQKIGLQVVSVNIMRAALLPVGRWGNEAAIFLETNQKHCRK